MTSKIQPSQASAKTAEYNRAFGARLPLTDQHDFEAAKRGLIAQIEGGKIPTNDGTRMAWDSSLYEFLEGECPDSVNPSLWRIAQLNAQHGLFEVVDGVWQIRGYDYANMTIVRGEKGWIIIDPLICEESSAAGLKLVNDTLGYRPVSAVLVTHTHPDHFAGLKGVATEEQVASGEVELIVPDGFMKYAASEGIMAGVHMGRRALYQFGLMLDRSETGIVDGGIGKDTARGQRTFLEPNVYITENGERRSVDGVMFEFQIASGSEAPSEFTFLIEDYRVMCMAEVCNMTMHNILTLRGAEVRDPLLWAQVINEANEMFGERTDVLCNSHNWPVWGKQEVSEYLLEQRDIYKYIHDQTLRLANLGHTPIEIAELVKEPEWLSTKFHARGYYGSMNHNVKATYQRYYGYFDGNPTNLDLLQPTDEGREYVEALGGEARVLELAQKAISDDKLRWAATLLKHLVFSNDKSETGKNLLAEVYEQLGYRAESSIWRNIYLSGAQELRNGVKPIQGGPNRNTDLAKTLSAQDYFNAMAVRLNPERAIGLDCTLNVSIPDRGETLCTSVNRQTEYPIAGRKDDNADASIRLKKADLEALFEKQITIDQLLEAGKLEISGDHEKVEAYFDAHDTFNLWFNIVTP
ncbi:alkyl/aryl-sulfatase [Marinobacterium sp. YM272]|uniref:alkyl/aryl-sulfatase n=1 Tax=Marinobacterium sp. YM272 TaxID=3421654 RepID=UPI003D7FA870